MELDLAAEVQHEDERRSRLLNRIGLGVLLVAVVSVGVYWYRAMSSLREFAQAIPTPANAQLESQTTTGDPWGIYRPAEVLMFYKLPGTRVDEDAILASLRSRGFVWCSTPGDAITIHHGDQTVVDRALGDGGSIENLCKTSDPHHTLKVAWTKDVFAVQTTRR